MDRRRRRGRGYNNTRAEPYIPDFEAPPLRQPKGSSCWSFINFATNLVLMASLIASTYCLLDYHCVHCGKKCENSIALSIDQISKNLSSMKNNYQELEAKLSSFSKELPKIEGQIEILETLAAKGIESMRPSSEHKPHLSLSDVVVGPKLKPNAKDISNKKCCSKEKVRLANID